MPETVIDRTAVVRTPEGGDVLAAAVTWAVCVAGVLALPAVAALDPSSSYDVSDVGSARWWAVLVAVCGQALTVAWARTRPVVALLGVGTLVLLLSVTGPGDAAGVVNLPVVVVVYRTVATRTPGRLRVPLVGVAVLVAAGLVVQGVPASGTISPGVLLSSVGVALALVAVGVAPALVVASRRAVLAARDGELRALAREQDALLRSAVAAERAAMAREVHDIAAHHLSGMTLMVSAIDRQVDTDPAAAHDGLRQVREQSRVVLNDLRRLVGLLRDDASVEVAGPLTLAAIPGLVAAQGDGPGVSIEVVRASDGAPLGAGVGPVAQLASYRMVQEALANARHHAPGAACTVTVDDSAPDAVLLAVRNGAPVVHPAPSPSGGHGLIGMRERAELVGGTLRHGPTLDGGWEVRLVVPRDHDHGAEEGTP